MAPSPRPATHAELDAYRGFAAAVARDDRPAARAVLDAAPGLATLSLAGSPAPLLLAARRGWTPLVARLVALGTPLDAPVARPDEHPLVAAAAGGHDACFAWLAARGVTLEVYARRGWSAAPLWRAVLRAGDAALAERVRSGCRALSAPGPLLDGLAESAAARCDDLALRLAADAARLGVASDGFGAALARVLAAGNLPVARALVDRGARLRSAGFLDAARLWPPVLRGGDPELAELALRSGFDVATWEAEHGSLLARWPEAQPRARPVIERLVAHGLRLDLAAPGHGTPLEAARRAGRATLGRFLEELGATAGRAHRVARP